MSERRLTDAELEASRWIARLEASDVTLEDHQRFRAWLDVSAENRAAHDAVSRSWDKLDALKLLSLAPPASPERPMRSRRAVLLGGGAATLAAGTALGVWLITPATTFAATYETATGERQNASLQDGSAIELNANTILKAAYTERLRSVTLDRGEALFTILSEARPFQVRARNHVIALSSGAYLIKLTADRVRLTIISGAANVGALSEPIGANNEALLGATTPNVATISAEQASQRLAWRNHMLALNGESLASAAAEIENQTGVRFVFADASLRDISVGGYIDTRDHRAFVDLLRTNLGLTARTTTDGSIELSR